MEVCKGGSDHWYKLTHVINFGDGGLQRGSDHWYKLTHFINLNFAFSEITLIDLFWSLCLDILFSSKFCLLKSILPLCNLLIFSNRRWIKNYHHITALKITYF